MSPVETQKIIWNKGYEELQLKDLLRNGKKFNLICNGDSSMIHVCVSYDNDYVPYDKAYDPSYQEFLRVINLGG